MAEFFSYLRNITYYLMFAALVNMAAPNGKYLRYIRLVTGLILVAMLFAPLTSLLQKGMPVTPVTDLFAKMIPVPTTANNGTGTSSNGGYNTSAKGDLAASYEQQQYEAIQTLFEDQLRRQLSGLLTQNGCTLHEASFDYASDFSELYHVSVEASAKPKSSSRPFIYIEPVRIPRIGGTATNNATSDDEEEDDNERAIKKWIADFYNLSPNHIDVRVIYE